MFIFLFQFHSFLVFEGNDERVWHFHFFLALFVFLGYFYKLFFFRMNRFSSTYFSFFIVLSVSLLMVWILSNNICRVDRSYNTKMDVSFVAKFKLFIFVCIRTYHLVSLFCYYFNICHILYLFVFCRTCWASKPWECCHCQILTDRYDNNDDNHNTWHNKHAMQYEASWY